MSNDENFVIKIFRSFKRTRFFLAKKDFTTEEPSLLWETAFDL
jgi:hypothetical protein